LPKHTVTRRASFSPEQLFAVVADVASYQEFLPLVERSTVRNRRALESGRESFSADLLVGYQKMGIQEVFASHVETHSAEHTVRAVSTGSAVKKLESSWVITPASKQSSDIAFTVDYEMKSAMLQMVMGTLFSGAAQKIMGAFEARARKLYGS
jgi:coenzyme Q-binding protein COQ10